MALRKVKEAKVKYIVSPPYPCVSYPGIQPTADQKYSAKTPPPPNWKVPRSKA